VAFSTVRSFEIFYFIPNSVKDKQYRVYEGNRETDDFVNYVKDKKWIHTKAINSWLTPDSLIMKLVGFLFKVTVYFKETYTLLNEKYELPNWAVLSIFIFATVFLGLILGVLLIICIDFVCQPRRQEVPKDFKNVNLYKISRSLLPYINRN
jgi:hypothetical protein